MKKPYAQFLIAAVAGIALRCSDPGALAPDNSDLVSTPINGMVISDPVPAISISSSVGGTSINASDDGIAYLSLAPRTLPNAVRIQIENRTRNVPPILVPIVDGGFDPVAVQASAGDTLDLITWNDVGTRELSSIRVPAKRPPSVVRSKPAKGITDVALSVVITVVFTEPVNLNTVDASSVQLLKGETRVSGKIVAADNSWDIQFVPDTPLEPNSEYQLVVTTGVRDLDGDPLDQSYNSSFVTGIRLCDGSVVGSACEALPLGDNVVTGSVIERSGGVLWPVPNATISAWVQLDNGAGYTLPPFQADANGKYTLPRLPAAIVQLRAASAGLEQRCGVLTSTSQVANIELVPNGSPPVDHASSIELAGFVYEVDEKGDHIGIPGVRVSFESPENFIAATATTDASGNYDLCRLPNFDRQMISLQKSGYVTIRGPMPLSPDPGHHYTMYSPMTRR